MEEDHSEPQVDAPTRGKSAKRKQAPRDNDELEASGSTRKPAPKRSKRDAMGNYVAKKKQYDKKIKHDMQKYARPGPIVSISKIQDKKVKNKLLESKKQSKEAMERLARAEILLTTTPGFIQPETDLDRTYKVKQSDIAAAVDIASAKKIFDLKLDKFGPYSLDISRSGKHILLGGEKGHVALFDWQRNKLLCELFLKENVHDVKFLHNETMFAVAQKKYVYIYDKQGTELHRMKQHENPLALEFLPYHFLLCTIGSHGILRYHDTSIGKIIAENKTKLGLCRVIKQNPRNAIIHLGHQSGVVTLWSPNLSEPHVKMLCHRGPVNDIAIDHTGTYMVTAGADGRMIVWDLRTYKTVQSYYTKKPVELLTISQSGLLATGFGNHVQIWKDYIAQQQKEPYLIHNLPMGGRVRDLHFIPFDDVLGIGHDNGYSSILVPGAGEANYDTMEANPFETKAQRRETTVTRLLEKLQPEMITIDTHGLGTLTKTDQERHRQDVKLALSANAPSAEWAERKTEKKRKRGKNKHRKTQQNVIDKRREEKQAENRRKLLEAQEARESDASGDGDDSDAEAGNVLDRFKRKSM